MKKYNYKNQINPFHIKDYKYYKKPKKISVDERAGRHNSVQNRSSAKIQEGLTLLIKEFITESIENQKQLAKAQELRANAQKRMIEVKETFLTFINNYLENFNDPQPISLAIKGKRIENKSKYEKNEIVYEIIGEMRELNMTYKEIAEYLEKEKVPTLSGNGKWHAQSICRFYQEFTYKDTY
ncbi:MAG: hypothetical protein HN931_05285 [Desulfobacterales bacterium]|jgi:hypothetical protein|nr:hypothetical protein [Desulfobacteraceae bacterium]MBT4365113.1 hypothetical protein [Desulfobacteraceae bacterium]MBT7085566.1 hypothetical protein [Desulfobacterales bacterium]